MSRSIADLARVTAADLTPSIKQQRQNPRSAVTGGQTIVGPNGHGPLHLSFVIESDKRDRGVRVRLKYIAQGAAGPVSGEDSLVMQSTQPGFGGQRWWFLCPDCRQRRVYLVLAPSAARFSCRGCVGGAGAA